jgi:hypothetical protein
MLQKNRYQEGVEVTETRRLSNFLRGIVDSAVSRWNAGVSHLGSGALKPTGAGFFLLVVLT